MNSTDKLLAPVDSLHDSKAGRWYDITAVIFCIAILILALFVGHFHHVGTYGVETDFYGGYAKQAENILSGRGYTFPYNTPGYIVLLAGTSLLSNDFFVAGKILSAFATAIFGWITYLLLKSLFCTRIALASTLLLLIALIPYSFLAATDVIGALGMIMPLWILLRRPFLTSNQCFLVGILAGVAYLIRVQAIFVTMGIGFSLLFININQESLRRRLISLSTFFCGVILVTTPWFVTNWQINGHPFASISYAQIAAQQYATGAYRASNITTQEMAERFDSLSDVFLYDPARILRQYTSGTTYYHLKAVVAEGLQFPAYLFAGAGLILLLSELVRRREDPTRRWLTFLMVNLFGYLLLGLAMFLIRFYIFLFPLLFLLVAYFLFEKYVSGQIGCIPFTRISNSWLVIVILAVFLGFNSYNTTQKILTSEPTYLLDLAKFLKKRSSPEDIIIARKPHLAYLSGLRGAFPLAESAEEYLEKAQEVGARYIVYSKFGASLWPGLKSLSDPEVLPNNFTPIYRHQPSGTIIYEMAP